MAFKEVTGGNVIDIKKEQGKSYTGVYVGSREIDTKLGKQVIYEFENSEGRFGIYGFTNLNYTMQSVKVDTLCRITYTGKKNVETKFGMKDVHQCKVEIDTDYKNDHEKNDDVPFSPPKEDTSDDPLFSGGQHENY